MRGAGGTDGGLLRFFLGLIMMILGGYLLLNSIQVISGFGWGRGLYSFGGFSVTSGMILIPFAFGVGIVFFNSKNLLGWILAIGSVAALCAGVIASANFRLRAMTVFDLITILVLLVGGIGLFLSSLRNSLRN